MFHTIFSHKIFIIIFLSFVLQLAFLLSSRLIKILLDLLGHNDFISESFLFAFSVNTIDSPVLPRTIYWFYFLKVFL